MRRINIRKVIGLVVIFAGVFLVGFYLNSRSKLLAEGDSRDKNATLKFGLLIDGQKKNFQVNKYIGSSPNEAKFLVVEKVGLKKKELLITNAGENIRLCSKSVIKMKNDSNAICFEADSGAHSQSLYLVKYENNNMSPLTITMSGEDSRITSDIPNIAFEDYDKDGYTDIVADVRDYDTDPMENSFRLFYQNTISGFTFDKEARI